MKFIAEVVNEQNMNYIEQILRGEYEPDNDRLRDVL